MKTLLLTLSLLSSLSFSYKEKEGVQLDNIAVEQENGIWFMKCEIHNLKYNEFLHWLVEHDRKADSVKYAVDDWAWEKVQPYTIYPFEPYYSYHPGFDQYPVVCISHEAATAFCDYLTELFSGYELYNEGRLVSGKAVFRLPTEAEWMSAAAGSVPENEYKNWYPGKFSAPQSGKKGNFNFNYRLPDSWRRGRGQVSKEYYQTAPIETFYSEEIGLYNMAGNVAEMVQEDSIAKGGSWRNLSDSCTIEVRLPYSEPNAWLGFRPVFELKEE